MKSLKAFIRESKVNFEDIFNELTKLLNKDKVNNDEKSDIYLEIKKIFKSNDYKTISYQDFQNKYCCEYGAIFIESQAYTIVFITYKDNSYDMYVMSKNKDNTKIYHENNKHSWNYMSDFHRYVQDDEINSNLIIWGIL